VVVVHHTDCGATHFTGEGFLSKFHEEFKQDARQLWEADDIGCIQSFEKSLKLDVGLVRNSPGTPKHVAVYGYVYDIDTGNLHLLEHSSGDPTAPRGAPWR
jgi:carbonic anhydrase